MKLLILPLSVAFCIPEKICRFERLHLFNTLTGPLYAGFHTGLGILQHII